MPLRRTILRLLLLSLALLAIAGVLSVLLPTRAVFDKVLLTGLTTAVVGAVLIPLTSLLAKPNTRLAALYGMCAAIVDFALWLAVIWLHRWLPGPMQQAVMLAILLAFTSTIMVLYLVLLSRAPIAGMVGVVFTTVAMVLFGAAIWFSSRSGWPAESWSSTAWLVVGYSVIVTTSLIGIGLPLRGSWRFIAAACGLGGLGVAITMMQTDMPALLFERWTDWLSLLTSAGALGAFVNLMLLPKLKPHQRWVRISTIGAALVTAVFANLAMMSQTSGEHAYGRILAASAIVTGCGSLALAVLMAINRRGAIEPSTAALLQVALTCPICDTKQSVPVGSSECIRCGLKMKIQLDEPRCPECDYLLLRLASDNCPECGALVRKPDPGSDDDQPAPNAQAPSA